MPVQEVCCQASNHEGPLDSLNPMLSTIQGKSNKSIRLVSRSKTAPSTPTPWLDGVLQTWDNPVFKSSELQIQRAFSQGQDMENGCCHSRDNDCGGASVSASSKLSKKGLQNAHVIAQVDKKFILVKMRSSLASDASDQVPTELLVLIDQHAADERVQVENAMERVLHTSRQQLHLRPHTNQNSATKHKSPPAFSRNQYNSASRSKNKHPSSPTPARFAAWGISIRPPQAFRADKQQSPNSQPSHPLSHQLSHQPSPPAVLPTQNSSSQRCAPHFGILYRIQQLQPLPLHLLHRSTQTRRQRLQTGSAVQPIVRLHSST